MKFIFFALTSALLLNGCASFNSYDTHISVDSIAEKEYYVNYVLVPADPGVNPGDLHFKEFARFTYNALNLRGFKYETDMKRPHLTVAIGYGVGGPVKTTVAHQDPIYAPSTTTTETNRWGHVVHQETTSVNGPVGYNTYYEEITNYDKYIVLTGYQDYDKKPVMKFETKVSSSGSNTDLRGVFPLMLKGALAEIGTNTGHQRSGYVSIPATDPELCQIHYGADCDVATGRPRSLESAQP